MIKRISILTLVLLFLVSTTGMPLIVHYCKIMETASMQECEMHSKEMSKSSCCQDEETKGLDECCQDLLIDHSVKENFITSKIEVFAPLYLLTLISIDINLNENFVISNNSYSTNLFATGNKLYLTNSILLI